DLLLLGLIALAIVASVQAVGNALIVGMLITPAAAARLLTRRLPAMLALGAAIGALSGAGGLYLSYYLGWASGATMTVTASACFGLALLLSPKDGLLARVSSRSRGAAAENSVAALPHPPAGS